MGTVVSLQETLENSKEDSSLSLADVLTDDSRMEEHLEQQTESEQLHRLLQTLSARERQIIELRYGLNGKPPLTQLETAEQLHISRSYVSRLESRTLNTLRNQWDTKSTLPKPHN